MGCCQSQDITTTRYSIEKRGNSHPCNFHCRLIFIYCHSVSSFFSAKWWKLIEIIMIIVIVILYSEGNTSKVVSSPAASAMSSIVGGSGSSSSSAGNKNNHNHNPECVYSPEKIITTPSISHIRSIFMSYCFSVFLVQFSFSSQEEVFVCKPTHNTRTKNNNPNDNFDDNNNAKTCSFRLILGGGH